MADKLASTKKISKGSFGTPVAANVESIRRELTLIWAAHKAVGLDGKMCLYTTPGQDPWRTQEESLKIWFSAHSMH